MTTLTASQAIAEILKSPDDLHKLPSLRKKLAKESVSIQSKLSESTRLQLDATRDGLRKLVQAKANLQAVEEEMRKVEKICLDPGNEVKAFKTISRVSLIHRNFSQTEEMVHSFHSISTSVSHCSTLLSTSISSGPFAPQPNLLPCHFQLLRLEAFRNETLHQAKKGAAEDLATVREYFGRLDKVVSEFEGWVWELAGGVLELVKEGRGDTVVKILKICEAEGREDEKAAAMKLIKRSKGDVAAKFKSMQAEARTIKHYRHKLIKAMNDSIAAKFTDSFDPATDNPSDFIESLGGWMYQDLLIIESDLVPCFPPDYDIHAFWVKAYHKNLDAVLSKIVANDPDASILLQLHSWVKEYKKTMKEIEVPPGWLQPALLGGKEQELIDDYVQLIVKKMEEWTANLMKDEERDFITRDQPVEIEEGGLYGLQGAVIMFQMVNQQIDLAADSGQGAVLARAVTEANRVMRSTQERFIFLVTSEVKKVMDKPDESPPGLVEYVVALANDQIKSADYAEALSARLEPIVSEKYKTVISAQINEAIDGYLDVAKTCTQCLIDLVFNDLKIPTRVFFTPAWYTERPMSLVVETMRDYLTDYQEHLNPSIFDLLLEDTIDTFLVVYLTALRKTTKLRMTVAVDRIREEVGEAFRFLSELKGKEELEGNFEVVEMVLALLEASKEMVFLDYWTFAKAHGPNLGFVEGLLRARDNLDRTSVNEIMENIKRKIKEEDLGEPTERTIMTKIAANVKGEGIFASLGFSSLPSLPSIPSTRS